jgi:hypothetical protein
MAQWGVHTIAKRSEEGSVETKCFKLRARGGRKQEFTNDLLTSERGTSLRTLHY